MINEVHTMSKILIAYFSRRGENYVGGTIQDLEVGNTKRVAQKIAALTGADLFEIENVEAYPTNYTEMTQVAMLEMQNKERPALTATVDNMEQYDTIILGYPNWWGTMPMCVFSFLESYNFKGKTILPFCTHEGSGLGHSIEDIRRVCPDAEIREGFAVKGSVAVSADKQVKEWLKQNNILNTK